MNPNTVSVQPEEGRQEERTIPENRGAARGVEEEEGRPIPENRGAARRDAGGKNYTVREKRGVARVVKRRREDP